MNQKNKNKNKKAQILDSKEISECYKKIPFI